MSDITSLLRELLAKSDSPPQPNASDFDSSRLTMIGPMPILSRHLFVRVNQLSERIRGIHATNPEERGTLECPCVPFGVQRVACAELMVNLLAEEALRRGHSPDGFVIVRDWHFAGVDSILSGLDTEFDRDEPFPRRDGQTVH